MASISTDNKGRRRILFIAPDGKRRTLRIGAVSMRQANIWKMRVEQILTSATTGLIEEDCARWLTDLEAKPYERLAAVGLVPRRERIGSSLGTLMDKYFDSLSVKASTKTTMEQTRASLEAHFGKTKPLSAIDSLGAAEWRKALTEQHLANATVARRVKQARSIFTAGKRWGMLRGDNPFAELKTGSMSNPARMHFVTLADARKVIAACPDVEWRVIVALSRWGGLRCPSEVLALRWQDVLWDRARLMVQSPKTEGIEGRGARPVPMFPELLEPLMQAFEQAAPGAVYVVERLRGHANLGVALGRIIEKAGLAVWPKPFHAMRSSRQTELSEVYPAATVAAWMGNTLAVAQAHYLQVRDSHSDAASCEPKKAAQNPTHEAAQTRAQHDPAPSSTDSANDDEVLEKQGILQTQSAPCETVPIVSMTPKGFEPLFPG